MQSIKGMGSFNADLGNLTVHISHFVKVKCASLFYPTTMDVRGVMKKSPLF